MTRAEILKICKREGVRFMRLQFSDIHGANKNVEVPASQFGKALDGEIMFDGSSIEGFTRIEESDMLLHPDLDTFRVFPFDGEQGRVARLVCDVKMPDGSDFDGDPRTCLKRVTGRAAVPDSMLDWVEERFGSVSAVEHQEVVKVTNLITLEGALYNALRSARPTDGASSQDVQAAIDSTRGGPFCHPEQLNWAKSIFKNKVSVDNCLYKMQRA